MLLIGVVLRDTWMEEGKLRPIGHAELLHDTPGSGVDGQRDGDDPRQLEYLKSVIDEGSCAFGGQSPALCGEREPPADFDDRLFESLDDIVCMPRMPAKAPVAVSSAARKPKPSRSRFAL